MSGVTRYDCVDSEGMDEALYGDWVTWDDHEVEVASLTAEVTRLREVLAELTADIDSMLRTLKEKP